MTLNASELRRADVRPGPAPTDADAKTGWETQLRQVALSARAPRIAAAIAVPLLASLGIGLWWFVGADGADALPAHGVEVKPVAAIPPIEEVEKLAASALAREAVDEAVDEAVPAGAPTEQAAVQAHSAAIATGSSPRGLDTLPAMLSHALVERVASEHARELSRCNGGEVLRDEVTVRFSVDPAGKVSKAQVDTTLRKPGVAACILRSVQKWQFPPQAEPGSLGMYTLSFQ